MFEGFEERRVPANGIAINAAIGGSGPPLLLLHGYPQSHVMWHAVAPGLAEHFVVVAADLRGYGDSDKPAGGGDHSAYAKRTMAQDMIELMAGLGHERFSVAGHDRGGRVAYRLALDDPERVVKLATLDIVPTYDQWEQLTWRGGIGSFHWSFLAQPEPLPERLIESDPDLWLDGRMASWVAPGFTFDEEAMATYRRHFHDPATIHASCEDYRAGATIDYEIDEADRGHRKIAAPVLALWGDHGGRRKGVLETWREWADDVRGQAVPCGHFLPEEAPRETLQALLEFFTE